MLSEIWGDGGLFVLRDSVGGCSIAKGAGDGEYLEELSAVLAGVLSWVGCLASSRSCSTGKDS